ncbi:hypothetical protein [Streptomyces sp. NPDC047079]|uniref:hypothetical protein n=1 Tax=Streptomyces sp. NPDC047079 TaxID=3154607 RepID=UPI0033CBD842
MSESTTRATDLTSQYAAQVTDDLERNVKEQDRVSAEIAALQAQLAALQHDHAVLVNMQQALGLTPPPAGPASEHATVPAARRRPGAKSGTDEQVKSKKSAPSRGRTTARKPTAKKAAKKPAGEPAAVRTDKPAAGKTDKDTAAKTAEPTLVDLVRRHLSEQSEPRSSAEIAAALGRVHPERGIKTTVIRTTLEGLVARNLAQRSKQGASVFYSSPDAAEEQAAAPAEDTTGSERPE